MVAAETVEPTPPANFQPGAGTEIDHAPLLDRVAEAWWYPLAVSCADAGTPSAIRAPTMAITMPHFNFAPHFYDKRRYVSKDTKSEEGRVTFFHWRSPHARSGSMGMGRRV